jgi:hypothetical protein
MSRIYAAGTKRKVCPDYCHNFLGRITHFGSPQGVIPTTWSLADDPFPAKNRNMESCSSGDVEPGTVVTTMIEAGMVRHGRLLPNRFISIPF